MRLLPRRRLLLATAAASLAGPLLASSRRALAPMTEGPFYPPAAWRQALRTDWDADLTRMLVGGELRRAAGEHLGFEGTVADTRGRLIDGAEVEIWQCDAYGHYTHPSRPTEGPGVDPGFQGFGSVRSGADGRLRLRTIRPVPYPGRTPHIHLKLRHASFGELTTQLFVAGEPGNARDGLFRRLKPEARSDLEMHLEPSTTDNGLRWLVRQVLTVPA